MESIYKQIYHSYGQIAHRLLFVCAIGLVCVMGGGVAIAGETDQFLTGTIELNDSADAFNTYLNQEIQGYIERVNQRSRVTDDVVTLTRELYLFLFQGLHASRVRHWLKNADAVERFPRDELSDRDYQRMSIYREPVFPFLLPMAQTIRVGDVYFGIDKIGHMLGFGRRYFQIYHRHRAEGLAHEDALDKVIDWGIQHENSVVGKLVDGIFSHGDLEANYQGFRMARAFSEGDTPLFYREGERWVYRGGLDIRDFITPDFDESYNVNHYAHLRHRAVAPILLDEYKHFYEGPIVQQRMTRYEDGWTPSISKKMIDAHFHRRGATPQHACWIGNTCNEHT